MRTRKRQVRENLRRAMTMTEEPVTRLTQDEFDEIARDIALELAGVAEARTDAIDESGIMRVVIACAAASKLNAAMRAALDSTVKRYGLDDTLVEELFG